MSSLDGEAIPRRLLAILLRLAPRPIRNAVVGAMLLLIVVVAAAVVIDLVAGDDPAVQRLETLLRKALMVMAFLVAVTCVGAYVCYVLRPNAYPEESAGS